MDHGCGAFDQLHIESGSLCSLTIALTFKVELEGDSIHRMIPICLELLRNGTEARSGMLKARHGKPAPRRHVRLSV